MGHAIGDIHIARVTILVPLRKACIQSLRQRVRRLKLWSLHPARQDRGEGAASRCRMLLEAPHDSVFNTEAILDELDFRESALLTNMDHARKPLGCRVRENVIEIGRNALGPNSNRAAKFL